MYYNRDIQMQTSTGAFDAHTRSNHQQKDLRMTTPIIHRTSGIYVISNTKNGKVYIGKGADIRSRWSKHKRLLKANRHYNIHLQRAWNKHGAKSFKFQILEYCEVDRLSERENTT